MRRVKKGTLVVITPDGTVTSEPLITGGRLQQLQRAVGGGNRRAMIAPTIVRYEDHEREAFVDENGERLKLRINRKATRLLTRPETFANRVVLGNIAIIVPEAKARVSEPGTART